MLTTREWPPSRLGTGCQMAPRSQTTRSQTAPPFSSSSYRNSGAVVKAPRSEEKPSERLRPQRKGPYAAMPPAATLSTGMLADLQMVRVEDCVYQYTVQ